MRSRTLDVLYERCCGLDVHRDTVVACFKAGREKDIRKYAATTDQLSHLAAWLIKVGCTHVAMESTGVYWKPIFNVLETSGMVVDVINARDIKIVPGRKTDVKDAEWICDVYRHGLVRSSFIPSRDMRELRELITYRRSLIEERTREVNRIHKVLTGANIKLSTVVHDIMGVSGRAMLAALASGETDPDVIAAKAGTALDATPDEIREAVTGFMGEHQRMMLRAQLRHIDVLNTRIRQVDHELDERLRPHEDVLRRLDGIPGVGKITAQEIVAAVGTDMSRFPSAAHLASWAKLCPGTNESAGKRRSSRTGKSSGFLRASLVEAAQAAARSRDTYLRSQYYRLKPRRGAKRAIVAVAHSILVSAYHIIKDGTEYQELGPNYLDQRGKEALCRQLTRRLNRLGFRVTIEPAA
jgi:transposase